MTEKDREYFRILKARRQEVMDKLDDPAVGNIVKEAGISFSEQAHFVYELLQNAADAKATEARFLLFNEKVVFAHNGTDHFFITDPSKEAENKAIKEGTLGSVNAITCLQNSTKEKETSKIGKFGIGFKSVYHYTLTPRIYSPGMAFMIHDRIIPDILEEDYPSRHSEETLFSLSFDNLQSIKAEDAFKAVKTRLETLQYPLLFLNALKKITYEIGDDSHAYEKSVLWKEQFEDMVAENLVLTHDDQTEYALTFSREYEGRTYTVVFFVNADGEFIAKDLPVFCYFPTKEKAGLRFVVHAPFLLNQTREGITEDVEHNKTMFRLLAQLAAAAIEHLPAITVNDRKGMLGDDILDITPNVETPVGTTSPLVLDAYKWVRKAIIEAFKTHDLLPGEAGSTYSVAASVYTPDTKLQELLSEEQLSQLKGQGKHWVFRSVHGDEKSRFIAEILGSSFRGTDMLDTPSNTFIEKQDKEWLFQLYEYVCDSNDRLDKAKKSPIFLDQDGKAASYLDAYSKVVLFLPFSDYSTIDSEIFRTLNTSLLGNGATKEIVRRMGIREPNNLDYFNEYLYPKCNTKSLDVQEAENLLLDIFECWRKEKSGNGKNGIVKKIQGLSIFIGKTLTPSCKCRVAQSAELYLYSEELECYFSSTKGDYYFLDLKRYKKRFVSEDNQEKFDLFIKEFSFPTVPHIVKFRENPFDFIEFIDPQIIPKKGMSVYDEISYNTLDGLEGALMCFDSPITEGNRKKLLSLSLTIWHFLCEALNKTNISRASDFFEIKGHLKNGKTKLLQMTVLDNTATVYFLREMAWLADLDGVFHRPREIARQQMHRNYEIGEQTKALLIFLEIKDAIVNIGLASLPSEQRRILEICQKSGYTPEQVEEILDKNQAKEKRKETKKACQENQGSNFTSAETSHSEGDSLDSNVSLINHHCSNEELEKIVEETDTLSHDSPARTNSTTEHSIRDAKVKTFALAVSKGHCALCNQEAPFIYKGSPYLEAHHINPLKNGGPDSVDNVVALCPNCHKKMDLLDLYEDRKKLLEIAQARHDEHCKKETK